MLILRENVGGTIVLAPKSRIDSATAGQFEDILLGSVNEEGTGVLIDCAGLDYISSAGLRSVLIGAKAANAKGKTLMLCSMKRHVRKVFDTVGFSQLLPIAADRVQALGGLAEITR